MTDTLKRKARLKQTKPVRVEEQIGGGYVIGHREGPLGRLFFSSVPYEHPTLESAMHQARALSEASPDKKYYVFGCATEAFDTV